jgi:3-dehydroquinate synthetase
MVDAAPSARHALATAHRTGALGVLHPPAAILYDTRLLSTLPQVGWREGMVEVLKAALALDGHQTEDRVMAMAQLPPGKASGEAVGRFVEQAIALKARVLADDPADRLPTGARPELDRAARAAPTAANRRLEPAGAAQRPLAGRGPGRRPR